MKFSESHEWVRVEGDSGTVGVTNHAQNELGEIVYVELPEVGASISTGDAVVVLESTKAAADVYSPVSGTVTAVNDGTQDEPELVNNAAEGNGWLFKIQLNNPGELDSLMDQAQYEGFIKGGR